MEELTLGLGLLGWSVYVGGALVMELVWRPAQSDIPGSQTAIVCQTMGRRYRWLAAAALAATFIGFAAWATLGDSVPVGWLAAGGVAWALLAATLAYTSFVAHPALHVRMSPDLSSEERTAARAQVGRAIKRMDVVLRIELLLALVATVSAASLATSGSL